MTSSAPYFMHGRTTNTASVPVSSLLDVYPEPNDAESDFTSLTQELVALTIELESVQFGTRSSASWLQFSNRRTAVESRLIYMAREDRSEISKDSYGIKESCRLAALLYVNMMLRQLPLNSACIVKMCENLRNALEKTRLDIAWGSKSEYLWWSLFIGRTASTTQVGTLWYLSHMMIVAPMLNIIDWDVAKAALQRVAWPELLSDGQHEVTWKEIEEGLQ